MIIKPTMMSFLWILIIVSNGQSMGTSSNNQEWNSVKSENGTISIDFNVYETDNIHAAIRWLMLDLIEKMQPGNCFALLFDAVYETVFSAELFDGVLQAARFVVKVAQDEDTLNPRPALRCVLENVRRAGCGGYVILLANGIQMERLLRFGDRTRIIDTRSRFIILHDYRLFVPKLHYLWKRFVNVIFARRHRQRVLRETLSRTDHIINMIRSPVYELSTVPFPIPIKAVFFTKILNFWQAGKFRYENQDFFSDKTIDLGGQTMQVVVLEHTPAVFKSIAAIETRNNRAGFASHSSPINYYYGLEIELLKAISKAMHFRLEFYETPDADLERWGMKRDNETTTGLLGDMHEGRADFALADLHHTEYHLGFMDLSIPYNTECLTFLTPEALSDNAWKTLIMPFHGEMWTGVAVSLFAVGFVFYTFSKTLAYIHRYERGYRPEYDLVQRHKKPARIPKLPRRKNSSRNWERARRLVRFLRKKRKNAKKTLQISMYHAQKKVQKLRMIPFKRKPEPWHDPIPATDIFDTLTGCIIYTYSMLLLVSLPRLPTGWPLRVLTGWYWVYCLLVVVAYRASFTAILANPIPRVTIDTLQNLAESSIRCGAWGEQNLLFFKKAQDPHSQAIGAKLEHVANPNQAVDQVVSGMYAYYENIYLLRQLRSTQRSEKARQTLHIMKQCAVHMPISIGLGKNSPLKPQVDHYVRTLVEGGLTRKWLSDAIERFQSNVELPPQEATIDLTKMYAGIIALGLGYFVGLVTFIAEKLYWAYFVETSPAFDKYLLGIHFRKHG